MKPYQLKLIAKLGVFSNQEETIELNDDLDIEKAIKQLSERQNSEGQVYPVEAKINSSLSELVEKKGFHTEKETE